MKTILKGKILTIPNLLSTLRILLIPAFMWSYFKLENKTATVILLALSGVTDALDGFIARRFDMVSDFGKALDPFADKLTQLAMFCCLLLRYPRMLLLIIVLCVKEVFVASTQLLVIHRTELVLGAALHGKITTFLLYAVMLLHLLWPDLPASLSWCLELLCIAMLLFSGCLYGIRNFRAARRPALSEDSEDTEDSESEQAC